MPQEAGHVGGVDELDRLIGVHRDEHGAAAQGAFEPVGESLAVVVAADDQAETGDQQWYAALVQAAAQQPFAAQLAGGGRLGGVGRVGHDGRRPLGRAPGPPGMRRYTPQVETNTYRPIGPSAAMTGRRSVYVASARVDDRVPRVGERGERLGVGGAPVGEDVTDEPGERRGRVAAGQQGHVVAAGQALDDDVPADKAGATEDEDLHRGLPWSAGA